MSVHVKVAGAWQEIGASSGSGGVPWAVVSGGTVTEYTKPDGSVMEVHTFTANGTLTVDTPGYADVLLVGGGAAVDTVRGWGGTGGDIVEGAFALPVGALGVTIGVAGTNGDWNVAHGRGTFLGELKTNVRYPTNARRTYEPTYGNDIPWTSLISGTSRTYGGVVNIGNDKPSSTTYGDGGDTGWGAGPKAGVVIVAVQKSAPTVSGVVATGGTITTYTGDGVNGVLGQNYKVHTFTAAGSLVVTAGGEADVLVVGAGSGVNSAGGAQGQGGRVVESRMALGAGAIPVTVGTRDNTTGAGTGSSLGGIVAGPIGVPWQPDQVSGAAAMTNTPQAGGITSAISGTSGRYGAVGDPTRPGGGALIGGAVNGPGVVIVRYKVA
jgi:hypothetical protein